MIVKKKAKSYLSDRITSLYLQAVDVVPIILLFTCSTFQACSNLIWFGYDMQHTDSTLQVLTATGAAPLTTCKYKQNVADDSSND